MTEQKSAGEVASGETPAGDGKAAESTAIEQLPHEHEYQARLPNNVTMQPVTTIWPENTLIEMRARWQVVQLRFADDPSGGHDTEQLRIAVQRYRDFYKLLLGY